VERQARQSAVLLKVNLDNSNEGAFRYVFAQPNDANRQTMLSVSAFGIPTAPATADAITAGNGGAQGTTDVL